MTATLPRPLSSYFVSPSPRDLCLSDDAPGWLEDAAFEIADGCREPDAGDYALVRDVCIALDAGLHRDAFVAGVRDIYGQADLRDALNAMFPGAGFMHPSRVADENAIMRHAAGLAFDAVSRCRARATQ